MRLEDALPLAQKVCDALQPFCERVAFAGSIRREKVEVGDVDIVAVPKAGWYPSAFGFDVEFSADTVWADMIPYVLKKKGLMVGVSGKELLRCTFADGFQVDLYRARMETWGIILLIRTGSKEHNVKLCTLARSKGLMLSAKDGVIQTLTSGCMTASKVIASQSEEDIFTALGLQFVEPKDREVS
jgi:DNA polymerase (family 10)